MIVEHTQADLTDRLSSFSPSMGYGQAVTARLAAAGSRRGEIERLLACTPADAPLASYQERIIRENVAGKVSEVSRIKLFRQLRERYVLEFALPEFRAFRWAFDVAGSANDRGLICLLMMARADSLFRELSRRVISSHAEASVVSPTFVESELESLLRKAGVTWSADTIQHVRQHVLSSLKDFGVLEGSRTKVRKSVRPGPVVAAFAAYLADLEGNTPRQTLSSVWFKLLGMDEDRAAESLRNAHRAGLLAFRLQADVVELKLPQVLRP